LTVAFDRDATLKKAEKLLRQGRLEPAIAEYVRVVEEAPGDWSTANTLGELYARAGKPDQAVEQYTRIAQHFIDEGFYPKAAAIFKKILKLKPQDEATQIQLADISARQGLLADAKSHLNAVAARRRAKGDRRGAAEIIVRLGTIDPADFEARLQAARTLEDLGEEEEAGQRFKALHADLLEKGRIPEALEALKEFVRMNPLENESRATLAKAALDMGDFVGAREFLDEDSAGKDPGLLLSLLEIEMRSGQVEPARKVIATLMSVDRSQRGPVLQLGWSLADSRPELTFASVDAVVDSAIAAADYQEAAAILQDFTTRVPNQIPALLKLVEVCVDGGLETAMYEAQEQLTDAYLAANQAAEARVIAEDLVAREPWEAEHIDRFRKALIMLRVSDPDTLIAERLSGQAPFMAHDPFFDEPDPAPASAEAATGEAAADETAVPEVTPPSDAVPELVTNTVPDSGPSAYTTHVEAPAAPAPVEEAEPEAPPIPIIPAPLRAPQPRGGDEIDLTGALGGRDEPSQAAAPRGRELDAALEDQRNEAKADRDFSAQHMTLARTYLEIGMVDEAISSLHTAARSSQHRFEAAATLGRLYDRRGDQQQAIEWLERAAETPAPTPDEGRTLLYDLGVLLEFAGETSRALAVFLEIQSEAGDYRDVPARIDRLARVQAGG
jgi:tetratricopeptide (TPR) repeat protein